MMKTIDTPISVTDPVISEVRRHKHAIAEEFGFDVIALARSLQQRQAGDPRFVTLTQNKGEQEIGSQARSRTLKVLKAEGDCVLESRFVRNAGSEAHALNGRTS